MNRRLWIRFSLGACAVALVASFASACSPMYVIRAGFAVETQDLRDPDEMTDEELLDQAKLAEELEG